MTNSTNGSGILGYAMATSGSSYGVYGETASYAGTGVCGKVTGISGSGDGVYGETAAIVGDGVHGKAISTTGQNTGVFGESASTQGIGVLGDAYATTGETYGVWGQSVSTLGIGALGWSSASTGPTIGVFGETDSHDGIGVYGRGPTVGVKGETEATGSTAFGLLCITMSTDGAGVRGEAWGSGLTYGVSGYSSSSTGAGIYGSGGGSGSDTTYGGWFVDSSEYGAGVVGKSRQGFFEGYGHGGYFETSSRWGAGVSGHADSADAAGVFGYCTNGDGVQGYSTSGDGVYGHSSNGVGGSFFSMNNAVEATGWGAGGLFTDSNDVGWAGVGTGSYKILGNGGVSFVQNHPEKDDEVIVYAAPEGNEVATYVRGRARLQSGEARVRLDDTFHWVTNPEIGLTAHLTPRGEAVPLAVVSLTTEELVVSGPPGGPHDVAFDYIVYGLRIGFEEQSIVQKKTRDAPIPSMEYHDALYAERPEPKNYNSLERFKAMCSRIGEDEPSNRGDAQSLIQSIGQGRRKVDSKPRIRRQNPRGNRLLEERPLDLRSIEHKTRTLNIPERLNQEE